MTRTERMTKRFAILKNLKQGVSITAACNNSDVPYTTFVFWKKKYARFKRAVEYCSTLCIRVVEDRLYTDATNGNTTAQIFFLKNRAPKRWRDKREIEMPNIPAQQIFITNIINKAGVNDGSREADKSDQQSGNRISTIPTHNPSQQR